jgi:putative intracellular protease/amidase
MKLRLIAAIVGGGVLLAMLGGAAWIMSLPPAPQAIAAPLIPDEEVRATLAALKPPKRERPVIAIIGVNDATETTDYLMPAGILRRADVADVVLLATGPGAVKLYPALTVQPDATIAAFDARHPEGADYVIVPAMTRENDPQVLAWIKAQAGKGAIVIGVCVGAKIVANAGLLDGRRATTHWFSLDAMRKEHPAIVYAPDRRIVTDKGVATTTGITASMPFSLTLVEAIAGGRRRPVLRVIWGLATGMQGMPAAPSASTATLR